MVEAETDSAARHKASGSPPPRRRWLYAGVGVVLAALLAVILVSTSSGGGNGGAGGVVSSSSPTKLPGLDANSVNLLSLSAYPAGTSERAPDFHLTDQRGQPVSISRFRGKAVVLSFTDDRCTDVCTLLAEDIVRADHYLGPAEARRVVFLSVNVNPFFPQVGAAKQWSDANDLGHIANWHLGTGPVSTLEAIWKKYGVYVGTDAKTKTVTHSALIELIGPSGRIRATADFGQTAVDVGPYSHGLAQAAVDLLPPSERTHVAGPQAPNPTGAGAGLGQRAPGFRLATLSNPGQSLDLAGLAGHPVVLNFWASTCQDCRSELRAFAQVAAADPKVRFVGIDVADPSPSTAASLARSAGIHYPILADRNGHVASEYKISGLPTSVYIDGQGHVAVVHPGAMTAEQLRYTLAQFFPKDTPQSR